MNQISTSANAGNGATARHELFALTDEQILEIDPVEETTKGTPKEDHPSAQPAEASDSAPFASAQGRREDKPNNHANAEAPELIAEAKALKEIYPKGIEQARAAADRARTFDEFDAAYFGVAGKPAEEIGAARLALAQRMLREDPAAFREMVAAGVKAIEESNVAPPFRAASQDSPQIQLQDAGLPGDASGTQTTRKHGATQTSSAAANDAQVAAYAEFEIAANAELEKSVGGAIEKTLLQALPNAGANEGLKDRLAAGVRQEIENRLQGDRQLGEQVSQVLSTRRFDDTSRAQVVRLINDRAQQLVPSATKRVLSDWTQTTLAAHRAKTEKQEAAAQRADLAPAQQGRERPAAGSQQRTAGRADAPSSPRGRIDYKKLSDEQILDL